MFRPAPIGCGDVGQWFVKAQNGDPEPLSYDDPYALMAMVWQQVTTTVKKAGEGFYTKHMVDYGTQVDPDYEGAPFSFTGDLDRVVITLTD